MTYEVVVAAEAEQQLSQADAWWREHRPILPQRLLEEFEAAARLLSELPGIGSRFTRASLPGVRRMLLRQTQFWVYYIPDESRRIVYILALWSTRRGADPDLALRPRA